MECSLGGPLVDALEDRVLRTNPDFSSAKTHLSHGDRIICTAPEILGKLLAAKQEIREQNKLPGLEEWQRNQNLMDMMQLDLWIKYQVRALAPEPAVAEFVRVCERGKIFVPRRHLAQAAA